MIIAQKFRRGQKFRLRPGQKISCRLPCEVIFFPHTIARRQNTVTVATFWSFIA